MNGDKTRYVVRPVRPADIDALFDLAGKTGGGLTNLPHDRVLLEARIAWSEASMARDVAVPGSECYVLVLENIEQARVIGTACIFAAVGLDAPFYSYRLGKIRHNSPELDRHFSTEMLHLVNDLGGCVDVGGLFLDPDARASGLGALLARSRYMFIAQHRERFGEVTVAELRGYTDNGHSPFWDAVGHIFFGLPYHQADGHNARFGNQFIADLMPRHPLYVSLLPEAARRAIGRPHDASLSAMRLLQAENFTFDGYVDIFDAGPTLRCPTAQIETVRASRLHIVGQGAASPDPGGSLVAAGRGEDFRCWAWTGDAHDDRCGAPTGIDFAREVRLAPLRRAAQSGPLNRSSVDTR